MNITGFDSWKQFGYKKIARNNILHTKRAQKNDFLPIFTAIFYYQLKVKILPQMEILNFFFNFLKSLFHTSKML